MFLNLIVLTKSVWGAMMWPKSLETHFAMANNEMNVFFLCTICFNLLRKQLVL